MTLWTVVCQLLCPRDFPGKITGGSYHFLLQGIFPAQGFNPHLPHWQAVSCQWDASPLSHQGNTNFWALKTLLYPLQRRGSRASYLTRVLCLFYQRRGHEGWPTPPCPAPAPPCQRLQAHITIHAAIHTASSDFPSQPSGGSPLVADQQAFPLHRGPQPCQVLQQPGSGTWASCVPIA